MLCAFIAALVSEQEAKEGGSGQIHGGHGRRQLEMVFRADQDRQLRVKGTVGEKIRAQGKEDDRTAATQSQSFL